MLPIPQTDRGRPYVFTVPPTPVVAATSRKGRIHPPSPGCPLCSILVNLEETSGVHLGINPTDTQVSFDPDRPLSPAFPSPAVLQKPLLSTNTADTRNTSSTNDGERILVVDDDELTGWIASSSEKLANGGRHIVLAFKRHIQDVYSFGPQDIPLLVHALETAHTLLDRTPSPSMTNKGKQKAVHSVDDTADDHRMRRSENAGFEGCGEGERRVGFVTGFARDPQFPYSHLHIHATLGPHDSASWYRRNVTYNAWSPGWWNLEDLIAEIRETTSNNRVKSGYKSRRNAPITTVPLAGSIPGLPNALEAQTGQNAQIRHHSSNPDGDEGNGGGPKSAIAHRQINSPASATIDDGQNVPPGLLDAVLREAERAFGARRGSENGGGGSKINVGVKGKQREEGPVRKTNNDSGNEEGAKVREVSTGSLAVLDVQDSSDSVSL